MDFYDVSEWTELSASSTKGTRDKLVLAGSSEDTYFLKFPMVREKRDYTPENWSEILAYEIGTQLGFNVLRYDLAIHNGRIGCISKNMITPSKNESLVEGHQFYHVTIQHTTQATKTLIVDIPSALCKKL